MVAAISGSGLGLYNTSATNLNGQGTAGTAPEGKTGEAVYVNTATGNLVLQDNDEVLAAEGLDVAIVRTYNSQAQFNGGIGPSWRLGVEESLSGLTGTVNTAGSTITKTFGDGATVTYTYNATLGLYTSTAGASANDTLSFNATSQQWTWTDSSSRAVEVYNASGQLLSSTDSSGNTVTYGYSASLLTQITDASGQVTTFTYSGGNISQISTQSNGVTQTLVHYSYDTSGRLSQVTVDLSPQDNSITDGNTYVTTYAYQGTTDLVSSITQSDGTKISFTYQQVNGEYRVATWTDGLGNTTTLTYSGTGTSAVTMSANSNTLQDTSGQSALSTGGTQSTTTYNLNTGATSTTQTSTTTDNLNTSATSTTETTSTTTNYSLNTGTLTTPTVGWQTPSQLQTLAYTASNPLVAGDSSGNNVMLTTSGGNLFAQRYIQASNAVTNPVLLTTLTSTVYSPSLSVDTSGNAIAAWVQSNGTTETVYAALYSASAGTWSAPVALSSSSAAETAAGSVAAAINGQYAAVVWLQSNGTINQLHGQAYNGTAWTSEGTIDAGNGNAASQPTVAIDASGSAMALWQQSNGTHQCIYVRHFSPAGPGTESILYGTGTTDSANPTIAFDSSGNAFATWIQGGAVYEAHYSASAGTWSTPVNLATNSNTAYAPSLSVDGSGDAVVAWIQSNGTNPVVYTTVYSASAGTWSAASAIESGQAALPAAGGVVVTSIAGSYAVVNWLQVNGSSNWLYQSTYSSGAWNAPTEVDSYTAVTQAGVAIDSRGHVSNVYQVLGGPNTSWVYRNGAQLATPAPPVVSNPQIGMPASGSFMTMWLSGAIVFTEAYKPASNTLANPAALNWSHNPIYSTSLAVDSSGNALAAWIQVNGNSQPQLYLNRYNAATSAWSGTSALGSSSQPAATVAGSVATAIDGQYEAAAWIQSDGTTNRLYVSIYNGSSWSTAVAVNAANSSPAAQPTVAIDASGNVMVLWQQSDGTASSIYANHYSVASGTWSGASLLESSSTAASNPSLKFDGSGNGFALWSQGGALYEAHYSVSSGTWSTAVNLAANANAVSAPSLSVDSAGNAIAAWIQSNGTTPVVYVTSYSASLGTWSAATAVETSTAALATGSGNVTTAINGSYAAVGWIQANGSVNSLYTATLNGTTWGSPTLMGTSNGYSASQPVLAIDSTGNMNAVWQQSTAQLGVLAWERYNNDPRSYYSVTWGDTWSSLAQKFYGTTAVASQLQSQMGNPTLSYGLLLKGMPATESVTTTTTTTVPAYYTVVSGDTWSSIAQKLYGTTAAASELQTQLGNPALTVGAQLTNLPASETVTTTTTVPPYYTVVSGDTWSSIAQKLYGTTAVASQLQTQQGNPTLTAGVQLTNLPSTEAVTTTTGAVGVYYTVKSGDTWTSITQALYGTSAASAVTALQTALSNPTLTTGETLSGLPATLSYSLTTSGTAPSSYTVQAGDSLTSITQALYGTSNPNAVAALQSALGSQTLLAGVALTGLPATLTYTQTSALLAPPYYVVQPNDTWATVALAIYGTSDPNAAAALQSALGNPTLSTGMELTVPSTLTYTPSAAGNYSTQTQIKDPLGNTTTLVNDASGRLVEIESPAVNGAASEIEFTYGVNGKLAQVSQYDEGIARSTVYQYDSNGNLTLSRDADGNTVTRTYDAADQVLTETTYGVADPNGSSPLDTASAMTSWYVYDAYERLSFILSPTGDVTEYLYDSHGNRTSKVVFTGAQYNVSGLSTTTCPTLNQMQSWAGSQNLTQTDRTDYTYDFRGNLATETTYTASSSAGAGAGTASKTQYVYDQYGHLLQVIDPRGSANTPNASNSSLSYATTYTYDGLGRVLSKVQWVASGTTETTLYQYDAANNKVTTTSANGLVTTSVYNADDELVSQAQSSSGQSLGTTTYTYDTDGLLRTVTNPDGIESHILYDADGRKVATVDGDGYLTQYAYNAAGQVIETIVYAGTVNTSSLADVSGAPANVPLATLVSEANTTPAANLITRSVYDAAGRLIYSIDDAGAVTESFYDGAGRLTDVIAYATPVSIPASTGELTPSQVAVVASANDRHSRNFYDANGNLAGTLDAAGYLTTYQYDDAGELVQKTAYYTATSASLRLSGTLAQLTPASDAVHDVIEHYFYDGEGRQVGVIDGDGYLTQTQYDAAGNVAQTIRYATAVTYTAGATLASLIPSGASQSTLYQYDGENHLVQQTNYQGTITQYQYDAVGNLISTTVAPGAADTRTTQTRYDALGRVIAELTPQGSAAITTGMSPQTINGIWAQYGVSYAYDAAGLKASMTDQAGNVTHYYYDNDGQLRYSVNAAGDVSEVRYDALGRVTAEITYNGAISTSGLTGGLVASSNIASLVQGIANAAVDSATTSTYGYDAAGRTRTTATAEGNSVTQQFDAFGDVSSSTQSITSSTSVTTDSVYDARGLLLKRISDPTGLNVATSSQYDAFGRMTQAKDADGNITTYGYDRLGRQVQITDALNAVTSTAFDAFGRIQSTTDALGNKTSYSYVDATRTMTVTSQDGITATTVDNEYGQKTQFTDGNGNITTYGYDTNGDLTSTKIGGVLESGASYDAAGRLATSTDGNGTVTSYTYDAANRVHQKVLDPTNGNYTGLNLTTTYLYDGQGRLTSTTSPQGVVTTTQYDRDGRVKLVTVDPTGLNLRTQYTYDDTGNVRTVTQGYGSSNPRLTQYTYDALGRKTSQVIDPGSGTNPATGQLYLNLTTQYYYDANGNLVNEVELNPLPNNTSENRSTWYVYDADNRLHYTIDSLGGITETDYDTDGRVSATIRYATAMTAPGASVHQVTTVTPVTSSHDRIEQSFYNGDGQLEYSIDAAGTVTQRSYDGDGNVIQLRVIGGATLSGRFANAAAVTTALTNSTLGSATALTPQDRVQWTAYDARNRAIVSIDALGAVTETQYDGNGNVVASTAYATLITPPSSFVTKLTASIPAGGGVPTLTFNGGTPVTVASSSADRTTRYWYDTAGRQIYKLDAAGYMTQTQYNDTARTQTVKVYARTQSIGSGVTASQLPGLIASSAGMGEQYVPQSLPTAASTTTTVTVGADQTTTTYYDTDGRVSQINDALNGNQYYGYDALGNKTSYTNQLGNTWTYKYDAAGRLITEDTPAVSSTSVSGPGSLTMNPAQVLPIVTQMTYDAFGNVLNLTEGLLRKSDGTLDNSYARTTTYGYDALGRQTSVTLPKVSIYNSPNGPSWAEVTQTGAAITANSTSQSTATHVVYNTLGDEIASSDANGAWTYKIYDSLGRVTYQIDALGNVTNYGYDQFGNQTTTTRYANALSSSSTVYTPTSITGTLTDLELTSQSGTLTTLTASNGGSSSALYLLQSTGQDRTITSAYDRDNRLKQVSEPAVSAFVPNTDGTDGGILFTASPTIFYDYNAFGQQVRTAKLVSVTKGGPVVEPDSSDPAMDGVGNTWSYTYTYYDQGGRKSADVNAGGYLSTYQYDAEGNLTDQYDYSQAVGSGSASVSGYTLPPVTDTINNLSSSLSGTTATISWTPESAVANASIELFIGGAWKSYPATFSESGAAVATFTSPAAGTYQYRIVDTTSAGVLVAQGTGSITFTGTGSAATCSIAAATADRETQYWYDQLNRKVAHILVGVQSSSNTNLAAAPTSGNAYTYYAYDAVGNQTSVTTNVTGTGASETAATAYTYYDVLGRVIATVGPTGVQGDASTDFVTPLTVMKRDVYGNLVVETQVAGGLSTLPAAGTAPTVSNGNANYAYQNRTTIYLRDLDGHATESDQQVAGGDVVQYDAYDAVGNLVKQYQPLNSTDAPVDNSDTLVTFYVYDKLGRQTQVITPESLSGTIQISAQVTQYNAFGEVAGKGTDQYGSNFAPVYTDFFNYDAAGRVYLTNTGDGVYRAYLYDLAGNATGKLEEQSSATASLASITSPAGVVSAYNNYRGSNSQGLMFTQTLYDAMGNVLEERLPTYSSTASVPVEAVDNTSVTVETNSGGITYLTWGMPADATLTANLYFDTDPTAKAFTILTGSAGTEGGYNSQAQYAITGSGLSPGSHTYTIKYTRPDGTVTGVASGSFTVAGSVSDTPTTVGTMSGVQAAISTFNGTQYLTVSWSPDNDSVVPTLWLLIGGTWQSTTGTLNEGVVTASLPTNAGQTTYQYRLTDALNGVTEAQGTGTITITPAATQVTVNPQPSTTGTVNGITVSGNGSTATVSWATDSDVTTTQFQIQIGGTWQTYNPTVSESAASVSFGLPTPQTCAYRIIDYASGIMEAESTGSISFSTPTNSTSIAVYPTPNATVGSLSRTVTAQGYYTYDESGNITGFTVTGSTVTLSWVVGSGTNPTFTMGGTNYSVSMSESGACSVSFAMPAGGGTYSYVIGDSANGVTAAQATGTITFTGWNSSTAGNATINTETQLAQVGGFQDLGNGILGWSTAKNSGSDSIVFRYKAAGAASWAGQLSVSGSGPFSVNMGSLSGNITYEVDYYQSGQLYAVGTGMVTVTAHTTPEQGSLTATPTQLSPITGFTGASLGNGILGWTTAPTSGTDQVNFSYYDNVSQTWKPLAVSLLTVNGTTYRTVNLSGFAASTYEYQVTYTASGNSQPYALGWGAVTVTATPIPASATVNSVTQVSAITGFKDLGNGVFGWTTPYASTDARTFNYTAGSTTGTLTINPVVVGSTTYYSVDLNGLPPNVTSVTFEVDYYTASGQPQPYAVGGGTLTYTKSGTFGIDGTTNWITTHAGPTTAHPVEQQTVDRWGNVISSTNAAGATTDYTYNRYNEQIATAAPWATAVSVAVTQNQSSPATTSGAVSSAAGAFTSRNFYDFYGNLIGTEDADGNINGKTNNVAGQLVSEQHADGGQKFYVYDAFGEQIEVITQVAPNANGPITTYDTRNAYDEAGRLVDTAQELTQGAFAASGQADNGFQSSLTPFQSNQNIILNQYQYDQAGRRTASTDGEGGLTQTAYDLHGNVSYTVSAPNANAATFKTNYSYDWRNNKTGETDADGNTLSWSYDNWGHLVSHVDMSGTVYSYNYAKDGSGNLISGILLSETSVAPSGSTTADPFAGVSKIYSYDSANHLTKISDAGVNSITTYEYDQAGRIAWQTTSDGGLIAEDTFTTYDAMGRIEDLYGLGYTIRYSYDKAGNRTEIYADYTTGADQASTQDFWYGYDGMNRVLISQGYNNAGQGDTQSGTVALDTGQTKQGTILTYDWRGDRTSSTTYATAVVEYVTESGSGYTTSYGNLTGTTEDIYTYDGAARLNDTYTLSLVPGAPTSSVLTDARAYDRASRMTSDTTYQLAADNVSLANTEQLNGYNKDGTLNWSETWEGGATTQGDQLQAMVYYTDESGNSYYDPAGNLMGYDVAVHNPNVNDEYAYYTTDKFTYADGDSYVKSTQSAHSTEVHEPRPGDGLTTYTYNVDQQLIQFTDTTKSANNRDFLNDAQGQAIVVAQGVSQTYGTSTAYGGNPSASGVFLNALSGPGFFETSAASQYLFYDSQGNSVGSDGPVDVNGTPTMTANFDPNLTPVSPQYPQAEPAQYVVQTGDTLALIAAQVYGDASLWYIIAEANGLTGLGPDTQLTSLNETPLAEGTSLVIPNVVVARSNNAQTFKPYDASQVLGDTTPYQAPPPPPQAPGSACGTFGEILMFAVAAVVAYFVGAEVFTYLGQGLAAGVAAGAAGATAGSIASQTVGIAIGEQNSFNWSEVASAAIEGAVGGGLYYGAAGFAATTPGEILDAAVASAAGQETNIAFGLQKSFNWEAVAAAAAAAPIAQSLGKDVSQDTNATLGTLGSKLLGNLTTGAVNGATYTLFTGGKINYAQLAGDSFGNAIGDGIVAQQIGLTQNQEEDMNAQIAAGAKTSMQDLNSQIELDNSTQLEMQQVSGQVAADNQAYSAQQESDFNAAQGLRDLAINGEYSIQTGLNQSLQKSLSNLQVPQVNFSVNSGATAADQVDYNPSTFYGDLQMRRRLESQGLSADQIDAQMAVYENPPATPSNSQGNTELNNLLYNTPLEQLLASPPPKGPFIGPIDYSAQARWQEAQNNLVAIEGSPLGATLSVVGSAFGASQQTQNGLLLTGTMLEGLGMAATGLKGGAPAFIGTQAGIDESLLIPPESSTPLPQSPNAYMRNNANILGTYVDPLTGNLVPATGSLSADHIVPQDWLISQPGFATMTPNQQDWILNHPLNTQGLPQSFNSSKGASLPGDWTMYKGQPLDLGYVQNQATQGQFIQGFMTNWINQFNKMNGK